MVVWAGLVAGEESCSAGDGHCGDPAPRSQYRKSVLVTGGAGFVAHHVVEAILETTDWDVVSLDRLDLSGRINRYRLTKRHTHSSSFLTCMVYLSVVFRLEEMLAGKAEEVRKRVRVIYGDLRAAINDQVTALSATQRC